MFKAIVANRHFGNHVVEVQNGVEIDVFDPLCGHVRTALYFPEIAGILTLEARCTNECQPRWPSMGGRGDAHRE
jgi:hypothetical protein